VNQYRVCCGSVEGCDVAQLRMGCGLVRVQCGKVKDAAWLSRMRCGSVRVRRGSVQGAAWLSLGCSVALLGCGMAQYRVRRGSVRVQRDSVQGAAWIIVACGVAQLG
jgi:hypothetical protein